jgi:hypothetical protein
MVSLLLIQNCLQFNKSKVKSYLGLTEKLQSGANSSKAKGIGLVAMPCRLTQKLCRYGVATEVQ